MNAVSPIISPPASDATNILSNLTARIFQIFLEYCNLKKPADVLEEIWSDLIGAPAFYNKIFISQNNI